MDVETKIPIEFGELTEVDDDRFMKVKIWIVNVDAPNYNGSYFSREAILDALPSIKNTPILGYVASSMLGDKDFLEHEYEFVVENGEVKERLLGQAYGIIPESCNPKFEFREDGDGNLQEYLTVEGLLWRKIPDATEIMDRDEVKFQSMEIHDDFVGEWDKETNIFHFKKFKFYGACILGSGNLPAIPSSTIEKMFSKDSVKEEISKKLEEFNKLMNSKQSKEVDTNMGLEELLAKYSITTEDLTEKEINVEEYSIEELEVKIKEVFTNSEENKDEEVNEDNDGKDKEDNEEPEVNHSTDDNEGNTDEKNKFSIYFELSHDDIRSMLYGKLGNDNVYISEVFDNHIIVHNWEDNKFYKVGYSKADNDVNVENDFVEVFSMFLTTDEKNALELMRTNFSTLENENTELKAFKEQILEAQKSQEIEELFAREEFSKLNDEDISEIKENVNKFSVKEIESKLYEVLGRKNATKYSKPKTKEVAKVDIKIDEENKLSSSYSHILKKYNMV